MITSPSLGLTAKAKISQTELKLGTLQPKNAGDRDKRRSLLPQTCQGGQITSGEIKDLPWSLVRSKHVKGRNSSNNEDLSIGGANARIAQVATATNSTYAGGDCKITKDLTA